MVFKKDDCSETVRIEPGLVAIGVHLQKQIQHRGDEYPKSPGRISLKETVKVVGFVAPASA
jgi:hypothetical protein